jgi:hypothetical protein
MTHLLTSLLLATLTLGGLLSQAIGDSHAAEVLQRARTALGGESRLGGVRAISATGKVTRAAGAMQLSGDLTLQIELPDRMLRTDSLSPDGGLTVVTDQGVNGTALLRASRTFNAPPGAVIRVPPPPPKGSEAEAQAVRAARADLARLTIALLLRAPTSQPLTFTYGGRAEASDGRADVLDITGSEGNTFAAKLFLDEKTHRPLMLSYRGVAPRMFMQTRRVDGPQPADGAAAAGPASLPQGDIVEIQMFLDDYRQDEGILLPHHITRSVGGEVNEDWTLASFKVNPAFKTGTFDAK